MQKFFANGLALLAPAFIYQSLAFTLELLFAVDFASRRAPLGSNPAGTQVTALCERYSIEAGN